MLTFTRCRLHFRSVHHRVMRLSPMEFCKESILTYNIEKYQRERQPRKPTTNVLPDILVSLPVLVKQHCEGHCAQALKGISYTHVYHIKYHMCKEKKRDENPKCSHTRLCSLLFCVLKLKSSSKKPPTLHHAESSQSLTSTYLWIMLLPDRNSSYSEKSPLNV